MKKLIHLIVACMFAMQVNAQHQKGKVMEGGEWHIPTTEKALELLMLDSENGGTSEPAEAILRQVFEVMPTAELDAFAEELGRIVRDGTKFQSHLASWALVMASDDYGRGTPYAKSTEILINIYESLEDRIIHPRASGILLDVWHSGGKDYVRNLFNASQKPPECQNCGGRTNLLTSLSCESVENPCPNVGMWCQAAGVLSLKGEGPSVDEWARLCSFRRNPLKDP